MKINKIKKNTTKKKKKKEKKKIMRAPLSLIFQTLKK